MIIILSASELTARIKAKALVDGKIASPGNIRLPNHQERSLSLWAGNQEDKLRFL